MNNIIVKENEALKSQLEQYKNYYNANIVKQKKPDVSYRKRKPNYRYSYHNDEDDHQDEELKNNYYIPAMNHLHPLKMKKELMMKLGNKDGDEIYKTGKTKKQQLINLKTKIIEVIQKPKIKKKITKRA